jgi:tetratricopeptide (TPR) repeat protein
MKRVIKDLCKGMNLQCILLTAVLLASLCGCAALEVVKSGYYNVKYNITGSYYIDNGKYKEGIEAFSRELQTNPENAQAHFYLGRCFLAENQPEEARRHLQKAAQLSPEKADYHFWLGVAYAAKKESSLERKSYLRALEIDPHHVQALTYLGYNEMERFEYENALSTYDKVLELVPDHPSALYNRALVLKRLKRTSEEKLAWKKYLGIYSSGLLASQAATNLNELGDFEYRNYLIGSRRITLKTAFFEPLTATIRKDSHIYLDLLGEILTNNKDIAVHIVAYQNRNKELAEMRAKNIKIYLLSNRSFDIQSSRLMVSWFGVQEEIKIGKNTFKEGESVNFITAAQR